MNRYRSVPGLGPQKAGASTTCQKCLKKGHYSYECKASLQERPYASRPSRSQLFKNPKLAPPLASEKKDDLMTSEGVADKILADAEAKRNGEAGGSRSPSPVQGLPSRRRSRSSSVDSVSTISTNKSRSPSPPPRGEKDVGKKNGRSPSRSPSCSRGRKRRYESVSSSSRTLSRSPPRSASHHKSRRLRSVSPDDRGRPHSVRRGSRRSRSRSGSGSGSMSVDKSRITKQRRLMTEDEDYVRQDENKRPPGDSHHSRRGERHAPKRDELDRRRNGGHLPKDAWGSQTGGIARDQRRDGGGEFTKNGNGPWPKERRERSLSPYSRRLALTQAMNISR